MKAVLTKERFLHTMGVAQTARQLAGVMGVDPQKAYLAGLLHDCAKGMAPAQLEKAMARLSLDEVEKGLPALWHAPVGAWQAQNHFGVKDRHILAAIRFHSTGSPGMGMLEKVLFVADYVEPNRRFQGLKPLQALARKNFELALKSVVASKLRHLIDHSRVIHPRSVAFWNSLSG